MNYAKCSIIFFLLLKLATGQNINVTFNLSEINIFEGQTVSTNFWIDLPNGTLNKTNIIQLKPQIGDVKIVSKVRCDVLSFNLSEISEFGDYTEEHNCSITGKRLGTTHLTFNELSLHPLKINVLRKPSIQSQVFRWLTTAFLVIMTFTMGCELEPKEIKRMMKKPIAPIIGLLCQFLLMPLIAFGLSQVTNLQPEFGFGLLTIGCSPGGGGSNVWTVLLNGDLNLSMTMTFLSTIAAMAMMPLWIFIFGRFYIDTSKITIPYHMIAINLIQIVVPVLLGMLLKHFKPVHANRAARLTRLFALLFVIYILSFGTYANLYMYQLLGDYPTLLPIGACLPWLGFLFGFGIAMLLRQGRSKAVTIALETGIQNIGIPILILLYSMPQPQGALGGTMPIVVAIFTPLPLYLIFLGMTIKQKCFGKGKEKEVMQDSELENENDREKSADGPIEDIELGVNEDWKKSADEPMKDIELGVNEDWKKSADEPMKDIELRVNEDWKKGADGSMEDADLEVKSENVHGKDQNGEITNIDVSLENI